MAIYHLTMSNVSRAKGSAATSSEAYITGEKIYDARTGETYRYGREERIEAVGVMLPEGAPKEFARPGRMTNSIELHEKTDSARTAKKIEAALPREWTSQQREEYVREFIDENFISRGYAVIYGIHTDPDNHNPHVHMLVMGRAIDPITHDWTKTKERKVFARDVNGNKIPVIDSATGQQKYRERPGKGREMLWQRVTVDQNLIDTKDFLCSVRESWAEVCNRHLDKDHQIDHRSYKDRGIPLEPTIHEGYAAREIEKRTGSSKLVAINTQVRINNIEKTIGVMEARIRRREAELNERTEQQRIVGDVLRRARGQHTGRYGDMDIGPGMAGDERLGSGDGTAAAGISESELKRRQMAIAMRAARAGEQAAQRSDRDDEQERLRAEAIRAESARRRQEAQRSNGKNRGGRSHDGGPER